MVVVGAVVSVLAEVLVISPDDVAVAVVVVVVVVVC